MTTPAQPRIDFPRVRLLRADGPGHVYDKGTPGEHRFDVKDVADMIRNFKLLCCGENPLYEVTLATGHIDPRPDMAHTALPAEGKLADVWQEGSEAWASFAEVDPATAEAMRTGKLRSVSVELYDSPEQAGIPEPLRRGASGLLLKRVALLGAWQPRVKGLGTPPWKAGEGGWSPADHPARYVCAEEPLDAGKDGAKAEQLRVARQAGFGEAFLGMLSDDVLTALITDVAGRALAAAGVGTAEGGTMSREQMTAELVKLGEDAATLQQLDDKALQALYAQKVKGTASPPAPTKMGEPAGGVVRTEPVPAGLTLDVVRQYAEASARTAIARAQNVGMPQKVDAFCAEMVRDGRLTPAQAGTSEAPGITRQCLLGAGAVLQFGEGPSALERLMDEIRARPVVRRFGELVPDPHDATGQQDVDARTKEFAARRNGRRG